MLAVLVLTVASSPAYAEDTAFRIVFRVYDGPIDSATGKYEHEDIVLEPGSDEEKDFLENQRRSNPGLVRAYEMMRQDTALRRHMLDIAALDEGTKTLILADDSRRFVDADGDGKPDTDQAAKDNSYIWPHASGATLQVSQSYFDTYGSDDQIRRLLLHEGSHTVDDSVVYRGDYGPDGKHYADEVLRNQGKDTYAFNASWIEGWANYQPLLFEPGLAGDYERALDKLRVEGETRGSYESVDWEDASWEQRLATEYTNSLILHAISRNAPGGREKLNEAFRATNGRNRDLEDVLHRYVQDNPEQGVFVAAVVEGYLGPDMPAEALEGFVGEDAAAQYRRTARARLRKGAQDGRHPAADDAELSLGEIEKMTRLAARHFMREPVEERLAQVEAEIAEIEKSNGLNAWDFIFGPFYAGGRRYLNHRRLAKLRAERQQLLRDLDRLEATEGEEGDDLELALPPPARRRGGLGGLLSGIRRRLGKALGRAGKTTGTAHVSSGPAIGEVTAHTVDW